MKRILTVITVAAVVVIAVFINRIFPRWLHARGGQAEFAYTHFAFDGVAFASTNYFQIYGKWPASLRDFAIDSPQNPKHVWFLTHSRTFSLATGDGWLHPLIYKPFDPSVGYGSVISYGRDGQPGGVGLDADVEVHFGEKN